MAIAVQDTLASGYAVASTDPTAAITVSATDANTIMLAFASWDTGVSDKNGTITSSLDTLTLAGTIAGGAAAQGCKFYYKQNPSSGAHTITFTHGTTASPESTAGWVVVLSGVSGVGTAQTNSGTGTSRTTTDAATGNNDWFLGGAGINGNQTITLGADQTSLLNINNGGSTGAMLVCSYQDGSTDDIVSYSWTGSQRSGIISLRLTAAVAAALLPPPVHVRQAVKRAAFFSLAGLALPWLAREPLHV